MKGQKWFDVFLLLVELTISMLAENISNEMKFEKTGR